MIHFFKPWRLGLIVAGVYLLAAVPCALMHWYEYSIPIMVVYYLSLPAVYGLRFLRVAASYV